MKTRHFLLAALFLFAFTSCSAELFDAVGDYEANNVLETEFNATKVMDADSKMLALPVITINEAEAFLNSLRSHKNVREELDVNKHDEGNAHLWELLMKQTIDSRYTFSIELRITSYDDGSLFYNGYNADCSSNRIMWQVGGFSFESVKDNTGDFKFKSISNIVLKVAQNSGEPALYRVPVAIEGLYHPANQTSSYTYSM